MKKLIIVLLAAFTFSFVSAQRVSLTKTAQTVEELQAENEALQAQIATLEAQSATTEERLNVIVENVDSLYQEGKKELKVPTTVEEAKSLFAYVLPIVLFLIVGIFKDKLPVWLTPFTISVIVGIVIVAIAYFGTGGKFSITDGVIFLLALMGGGNAIHQIKKPPKDTPGTVAT